MTQTFHISDVLRCILTQSPEGPNWACPRESRTFQRGPGKSVLWSSAFTQRQDRVTLVRRKGIRLGGLVSAKMRSGHRAWEVDHLYLSRQFHSFSVGNNGAYWDGNSGPLEILEGLAQAVGCRYGERIFLRLSQDCPLTPLARQGGFFPCFQETLLEGRGGRSRDAGAPNPGGLRQARQEDRFPLFQLFSAATPPRQREKLGLTFDQWRDALERPSTDSQEWVTEHQGRITGWLHLSHRGGAAEGEALTHPDHPGLLPQLLRVALDRPGWQRWWVPDYQERMVQLLQASGLRQVAQYTMFIKTVAAPVRNPGMAPVEA